MIINSAAQSIVRPQGQPQRPDGATAKIGHHPPHPGSASDRDSTANPMTDATQGEENLRTPPKQHKGCLILSEPSSSDPTPSKPRFDESHGATNGPVDRMVDTPKKSILSTVDGIAPAVVDDGTVDAQIESVEVSSVREKGWWDGGVKGEQDTQVKVELTMPDGERVEVNKRFDEEADRSGSSSQKSLTFTLYFEHDGKDYAVDVPAQLAHSNSTSWTIYGPETTNASNARLNGEVMVRELTDEERQVRQRQQEWLEQLPPWQKRAFSKMIS